MRLRLEKHEDSWRASAEEMPGAEAVESTFEAALSTLVSKLFKTSSIGEPEAIDVVLHGNPSGGSLVTSQELVDRTAVLAADLTDSLKQALEETI